MENLALVKVQYNSTWQVLQNSCSEISTSIFNFSRVGEDLNAKKPLEKAKQQVFQINESVKDIQKDMDSVKLNDLKRNDKPNSIGNSIELNKYLSQINVFLHNGSSADEISKQMHQKTEKENKLVEVPYKLMVELDEKVPYEEKVLYNGKVECANKQSGDCSGHSVTFWRCVSCSYDWNRHYNGFYCNKCKFNNASFYSLSANHIKKKIHCRGDGFCGPFWICPYKCLTFNYYQQGAPYCMICSNDLSGSYTNINYVVEIKVDNNTTCIEGNNKNNNSHVYDGEVKCKGVASVKLIKTCEGTVSYQCPTEHHGCHCQQTSVLILSLKEALAELDDLRSENDNLRKTIQKLQEKYKDITNTMKCLTPEIETAYEKVSQTVSIVEKETDYLKDFQNEQKDKFSTFLKFKEILDQQEKDRSQQEIDFLKKEIENKEQKMELNKNKYKDIKNLTMEKIDHNIKTIAHLEINEIKNSIKHDHHEQMAIRTITDLAIDHFMLMDVDPKSISYYMEELSKDDLSLQAVVKKVEMWVRMEKVKTKK